MRSKTIYTINRLIMNKISPDLKNNRFNPILWLCDSVVRADKNGVVNCNDGFPFVLPK